MPPLTLAAQSPGASCQNNCRCAARRSVECRIKCASDFGIQITDKMTGTNTLHQLTRRSLDFDSGTAGAAGGCVSWVFVSARVSRMSHPVAWFFPPAVFFGALLLKCSRRHPG